MQLSVFVKNFCDFLMLFHEDSDVRQYLRKVVVYHKTFWATVSQVRYPSVKKQQGEYMLKN